MKTEQYFHHKTALGSRTIEGVQSYKNFPNKLFALITQARTEAGFSLVSHEGKDALNTGTAKVFQEELSAVVRATIGDLNPSDTDTQRAIGMAPDLLKAIIRSPYISGINQGYTLDMVRWCLEAARKPDLISRTKIRIGYGGSDDKHITLRQPAYLLPAIDLWKRLAQIQDAAGIFERPRIQLIHAYNAGIQINHKDAQRTEEHARESSNLSLAFIQRFFPEVMRYVELATDNPPHMYGPYTDLMTGYFGEIIKKAYEDPQHSKLKMDLVRLAMNHGKSNGDNSEEAAVSDAQFHNIEESPDFHKAVKYAANHVFFFQDQIQVPHVSRVSPRDRAYANMTIGGRPERLFNAVRQLVSEQTTAEGLVTYAHKRQMEGVVDSRMVTLLEAWAQAYKSKLSTYKSGDIDNRWASTDLPLITMPLITDIGKCPVYYAKTFDPVLHIDHIDAAKQMGLQGVAAALYHSENDSSLKHRTWYQAIEKDISILTQAVPETELVDFYEGFLQEQNMSRV